MSGALAPRYGHGGSFIVDRNGTILGFDAAMERLIQRAALEVVGRHKSLRDTRTVPADANASDVGLPVYLGELPECKPGGSTHQLTLFDSEGRRITVDARIRRLDGPGERVQVDILRVVERGARFESLPGGLAALPEVDPLTGLARREAFQHALTEHLGDSRQSARPLALVIVDVDHLRDVNDRLGQRAGDLVLRKLAGVLRSCVHDDERIFRLADDDFAILLPGSGRGEARQVAAGIRSTALRQRFLPDCGEAGAPITLSIGAASYPADADRADLLIQRATEALDEARSMGRNRVWCYLRRPRVPLEVPVYFDATDPLLVGYTRDLSPSGLFVQTSAPMEIGMRCGLAFPLPGYDRKVRVIGRVVRTVPVEIDEEPTTRIPGMGLEFEHFGGGEDRRAIDAYLHEHEAETHRPEDGRFSI